MKRFLIIKTSSLGDIIHTFAVVDCLKGLFPDSAIDWVVEAPFSELVKAHPKVSEVICVSTKQWRRAPFAKNTRDEFSAFRNTIRKTHYDAAFDLQGNVKSGLILACAKSGKKVGFNSSAIPEWPNLLFTNTKIAIPSGQNIREDYLNVVKGFFSREGDLKPSAAPMLVSHEQALSIDEILSDTKLKGQFKIVVCPSSAWKNKQMEPSALAQFLTHIAANNDASFLFVWGSPEEKQTAEFLQAHFPQTSVVVPRLRLPALQVLMQKCSLVISVDSLALHLAGTTTTPSFALFGPSSAHKYNPQGPTHGAYQGPCPYGRKFEKRCPVLRTCPTGACIRGVTGADVYASFAPWWNKILKDMKFSGKLHPSLDTNEK